MEDRIRPALDRPLTDTPEQTVKKPKRKRAPRKATGRRPARLPGKPPLRGSTAKRLVEITLTARHGINGINYGPGTVTVHQDVAAMLREQETRRHRERDRFYATDRAFVIGRGLRPQRVPYETFDDTYGQAQPIGAVSGRTLKSSF